MEIKTKAELLKMQEKFNQEIKLRTLGKSDDFVIEILVGMATCGIASGAKDTYDKIQEILLENEIKNVKLVSVGCIGYCYLEPTLQVCIPGKEPVFYGKITEDVAEDFIETVVVKKDILKDHVVHTSFERAGVDNDQ